MEACCGDVPFRRIVRVMESVFAAAFAEIRARITGVRPWGPDGVAFELDGVTRRGRLTGRNRDLVLGVGEAQDKAIALRVLLDGGCS